MTTDHDRLGLSKRRAEHPFPAGIRRAISTRRQRSGDRGRPSAMGARPPPGSRHQGDGVCCKPRAAPVTTTAPVTPAPQRRPDRRIGGRRYGAVSAREECMDRDLSWPAARSASSRSGAPGTGAGASQPGSIVDDGRQDGGMPTGRSGFSSGIPYGARPDGAIVRRRSRRRERRA